MNILSSFPTQSPLSSSSSPLSPTPTSPKPATIAPTTESSAFAQKIASLAQHHLSSSLPISGQAPPSFSFLSLAHLLPSKHQRIGDIVIFSLSSFDLLRNHLSSLQTSVELVDIMNALYFAFCQRLQCSVLAVQHTIKTDLIRTPSLHVLYFAPLPHQFVFPSVPHNPKHSISPNSAASATSTTAPATICFEQPHPLSLFTLPLSDKSVGPLVKLTDSQSIQPTLTPYPHAFIFANKLFPRLYVNPLYVHAKVFTLVQATSPFSLSVPTDNLPYELSDADQVCFDQVTNPQTSLWALSRENNVQYVLDTKHSMYSSGNGTEKLRVRQFSQLFPSRRVCIDFKNQSQTQLMSLSSSSLSPHASTHTNDSTLSTDVNSSHHPEVVCDLYTGIGYFSLPYLLSSTNQSIQLDESSTNLEHSVNSDDKSNSSSHKLSTQHLYACELNPIAILGFMQALALNFTSSTQTKSNLISRCSIFPGDNRRSFLGYSLRNHLDRCNLGLIPHCLDGLANALCFLQCHFQPISPLAHPKLPSLSTSAWLHIHWNAHTTPTESSTAGTSKKHVMLETTYSQEVEQHLLFRHHILNYLTEISIFELFVTLGPVIGVSHSSSSSSAPSYWDIFWTQCTNVIQTACRHQDGLNKSRLPFYHNLESDQYSFFISTCSQIGFDLSFLLQEVQCFLLYMLDIIHDQTTHQVSQLNNQIVQLNQTMLEIVQTHTCLGDNGNANKVNNQQQVQSHTILSLFSTFERCFTLYLHTKYSHLTPSPLLALSTGSSSDSAPLSPPLHWSQACLWPLSKALMTFSLGHQEIVKSFGPCIYHVVYDVECIAPVITFDMSNVHLLPTIPLISLSELQQAQQNKEMTTLTIGSGSFAGECAIAPVPPIKISRSPSQKASQQQSQNPIISHAETTLEPQQHQPTSTPAPSSSMTISSPPMSQQITPVLNAQAQRYLCSISPTLRTFFTPQTPVLPTQLAHLSSTGFGFNMKIYNAIMNAYAATTPVHVLRNNSSPVKSNSSHILPSDWSFPPTLTQLFQFSPFLNATSSHSSEVAATDATSATSPDEIDSLDSFSQWIPSPDSHPIPSHSPTTSPHLSQWYSQDELANIAFSAPNDVPIFHYSSSPSSSSSTSTPSMTFTHDDFISTILPLAKPVILRGLPLGSGLTSWQDFPSLLADINHDAQVDSREHHPISVHRAVDPLMNMLPRNFTFETMTLPQLISSMRDQFIHENDISPLHQTTPANDQQHLETDHNQESTHQHAYYYLRSMGVNARKDIAHVAQSFPTMAKNIIFPSLIPSATYFSSVLRVGSVGMQLWMHYDVADNFLMQYVGWKRVTLLHPLFANAMGISSTPDSSSVPYTDIDLTQLWHQNEQVTDDPTNTTSTSEPNDALWRLQRDRPGLFLAYPYRHEVLLCPGDVLFLPAFWLHHVTTIEPPSSSSSISSLPSSTPSPSNIPVHDSCQNYMAISVNVFWRHLCSSFYKPKDLYGNKDVIPGADVLSSVVAAENAVKSQTTTPTASKLPPGAKHGMTKKQLSQLEAKTSQQSVVSNSNEKEPILEQEQIFLPQHYSQFYLGRALQSLSSLFPQ